LIEPAVISDAPAVGRPAQDEVAPEPTAQTSADSRDPSADGSLRSAIVVNPARVQDLPERRRVIEESLAAAGWPLPAWFETTPEDTGTGQARQAVAQGAELVFVCGGDGTVRSVIAGLIGTDAALAVLPASTGNLLAGGRGAVGGPTRSSPGGHRGRRGAGVRRDGGLGVRRSDDG
jgi:hypothetical protein